MFEIILDILIAGLIGYILTYLPIPQQILNYIGLFAVGFLSLAFLFIFMKMNYNTYVNYKNWEGAIFIFLISLLSLGISLYTMNLTKRLWNYIQIQSNEDKENF